MIPGRKENSYRAGGEGQQLNAVEYGWKKGDKTSGWKSNQELILKASGKVQEPALYPRAVGCTENV